MFGSRVMMPFLFQRLEMAHHAVGRADAELLADFADRRPVAAVLDLVADEVVDLALFFRKLIEFVHGDGNSGSTLSEISLTRAASMRLPPS